MCRGREWERFAWLKSRVVAPAAIGSACAQSLRAGVTPFVFRRYLDYNVFDSLRDLHRQIRDHAAKRSAGKPERANDVKLFTRWHPRNRVHGAIAAGGTRRTVSRIAHPSHAKRAAAPSRGELMSADRGCAGRCLPVLRRVEHRIQYLDDQQTHILPTADADLLWIAQTMGFADSCGFPELEPPPRVGGPGVRSPLLGGADIVKGVCKGPVQRPPAHGNFDELLAQLSGPFRERLAVGAEHLRMLALREVACGCTA